jgi:hypothetical protein
MVTKKELKRAAEMARDYAEKTRRVAEEHKRMAEAFNSEVDDADSDPRPEPGATVH